MKTKNPLLFTVGLLSLALVFAVAAWKAIAAAPDPVITISPLSSNQYSITITNAGNTNYTLMWTPSLGDANYPWQVLASGSLGQSNFTVDGSVWPIGFFQVIVGDDADGDGVPIWMDANPYSAFIGALQVTITSPTNGATLQ